MKRTFKLILLAGAVMASDQLLAAAALEEVTVTAQRRTETLQDAALAIDAFSGKRLIEQGISTAEDLTNIVPALTITSGGGLNGLIYMRGVGNQANNNYLDPAITMTYDGVVLARGSGVSIPAFYDLERVEVLKGPQGTLYGKNATGGVINVIPVKPQLGETGGFVNGSVGNYDETQLSGAFNLPIGESSALRIAARTVQHDGYNNDGTQDQDSDSVRLQFLTEFSEDLSVRIAGDYADIGGTGSGTTATGSYIPAGLANYIFTPSGLDRNEGQDTAKGNAYRNTILGAPGFGFYENIQDNWNVDGTMKGVNAEINYNSGIGQFTFIPAWRKTDQDSKFGQPGFNSGWWNSSVEQTSMELRLAGDTEGMVDYLVGAFYFEEQMEGNNTFNQEFVLPLQDYKQDSDSWATFGQLTWKFTEDTRLITGVRYTDDNKKMKGGIDNYITFCGGLPPNNVVPPASFGKGCQIPGNLPHYPTFDTTEQTDAWLVSEGWASAFIPIPPGYAIPLNNGVGTILHAITDVDSDYDKQKTTYRASLEWDAAADSMIYLAYETGYRAGGLQPNAVATYDPEYIDAYTIGSKNRFLQGRLQLNAELFWWDYKDQQISYFALTDQGVLENQTDNVGKATNKGVDVDMQWLATENTLLSAKVQYLDASYDDLHFETAPPRDNINCPFTVTGTLADGVTPALDFNCSGNDSIFSPDWTVLFGIQQTFPLGSVNLIASVDTTWTDDQVSGFQNLPTDTIESYWRTNVDLTLASADDTWSITAYARNLEDKNRLQSSQAPLLGMAMGAYGPDMTYGVRLNYNF